ncbi:MAG: phosphoribosylglycinamide formyltransferase [Desulfuromonadaceae bacterium]|nr:phosphoribosylglycinamide formyltransferase [Desulfuromonas sp.]MDY0185202.1 phosphoribosylglycinamide formyltransferase [Desulfuromonadaceae bacterium]
MKKRTTKLRLGVLASGSGTNLQSIIDACANDNIDAQIVRIICNNPDAGALQRAERAGIPRCCINHRVFTGRRGFDAAIIEQLQHDAVDLVVLAGFMRIVGADFVQAFPQRIMNIHPALLPAFPGLQVQKKALESGARFSGCTVHFVDAGVDTGPIIIQAVVPILADDTEESLSARILEQEHRIYPLAIQLFAANALKVEGQRVIIEQAWAGADKLRAEVLLNPPYTTKTI